MSGQLAGYHLPNALYYMSVRQDQVVTMSILPIILAVGLLIYLVLIQLRILV